MMNDPLRLIVDLCRRISTKKLNESGVIQWASPVPSFGTYEAATLATVGLNPSNREFVGVDGKELKGPQRRFETLSSLGIPSWEYVDADAANKLKYFCDNYFSINPYGQWFRVLEQLISETRKSYYFGGSACHLDLVPYATYEKWGKITAKEKSFLIGSSSDSLGIILNQSNIRTLVLNGAAVIDGMESMSDLTMERSEMEGWALSRGGAGLVKGYGYVGELKKLNGITMDRRVNVLGFNHNIQSSFGVTSAVRLNIQKWLARKVLELENEKA